MPEPNPAAPAAPAQGALAAQGGAPGRETERLADLAQQIQAPRPQPRTYIEQAGTIYMGIVLGVICFLTVAFLATWAWTRTTLVDAAKVVEIVHPEAGKTIQPQELADLLAKLQHEHTGNFRDCFQLLVMSALVPLFTLLAGYVFGKETGRREGEAASRGSS